MLYGLLLEGANAQEQNQEVLQAHKLTADEDESWWLGMEAWVCCETMQTHPLAGH